MKIRTTLAALAVASVLVATVGCSAEELPQAAGAAGGSGSGSSDEAGTESGDDTGADSERDARDTDGDGEVSLEECLPGNWFVDNDSFAALMSGTAGGAVDNITGVVMLTFTADGKTQTAYEDWRHSITVDSATVTIVKNGTDFGTYSVNSDGSIALLDTQINSETTSVMSRDGQTVTHTVTPEPSVFSHASFDCSGDELSVTAEGATTILHREH